METRAELNSIPNSETLHSTALYFPVNDDEDGRIAVSSQLRSPTKLPRRLRRRLLESKSPSPTAQDIETKLRNAQLRRQQFYEILSNKARKKATSPSSASASSKEVDHRNFILCKLARCWKHFVREKGTTLSLAKTYIALGIDEHSVRLMPFEQLAPLIDSGATIKTTKALLDRLEIRINIMQEASGADKRSTLENIDHLLKQVISLRKRDDACKFIKSKRTSKMESGVLRRHPMKLSRYPVRVVLCAYMILGHPEAVFSGNEDYEVALAKSAKAFIHEFELPIRIIMEGPAMPSIEETISSAKSQLSFKSQLENFDKAWCSYLYSFVRWKVKDARMLEEDLVKAACQLEVKMIQSLKEDIGGSGTDMKALQEKVAENQKLLQSSVQQLSGNAGLEHMGHALSVVRSQFIDAEAGCSLTSSPTQFSSPSSDHLSQEAPTNDCGEEGIKGRQKAGHNQPTCDLLAFSELGSVTAREFIDSHLNKSPLSSADNEVLVNEILHEHRIGLVEGLSSNLKNTEDIKMLVKNTMEKAFWDGVLVSLKQENPDYGWVLKLAKEVRDELCEISPASWREKIIGAIDIDFLSQVLRSGTIDMDCLRGILEFALDILLKLSAPAKENELKSAFKKFLKELDGISISETGDSPRASFALLAVEGLRFVLHQIQLLKHDISRARFSMLETLIKGPAGFEYLRSAFTTRYGPPSEAPASLPLVVHWLSTVMIDAEKEWNDHLDCVSALSSQGLPPTTLRTGGSILNASTVVTSASTDGGAALSECKGEKVDLCLRLGLLKLVSEVRGLTAESLPETLKLNMARLRSVQSKLQKIVVICCSVLILRQTIISDQLMTSSADMENIILKSVNRLMDLLDSSEDLGVSEIIETLNCFLDEDDLDKCRARSEVMANMLVKSLRGGDTVFERVSGTVYLAAREVVLAGCGMKGRPLAEVVLKRIGASFLTEKLVEAMEDVVVVANVSAVVHWAWYEEVLKKLK